MTNNLQMVSVKSSNIEAVGFDATDTGSGIGVLAVERIAVQAPASCKIEGPSVSEHLVRDIAKEIAGSFREIAICRGFDTKQLTAEQVTGVLAEWLPSYLQTVVERAIEDLADPDGLDQDNGPMDCLRGRLNDAAGAVHIEYAPEQQDDDTWSVYHSVRTADADGRPRYDEVYVAEGIDDEDEARQLLLDHFGIISPLG